MTYSTMIIDATRLQSVRNNIQGAGDLTLNAALSEYDVMLEEMYGLFGNVKDTKEMEVALKSYFQQTLQSELYSVSITDVSEKQTEKVADDIVAMIMKGDDLTDDDLTDFINAQVDTFACEPVKGSSLGNPAVLKQQIVEYMKYKAPISIATGLVAKMKAMNNAKAQNEAIEEKVKYEEKLSTIQDWAIKAFNAIDDDYNMGALIVDAACEDAKSGSNPVKKQGIKEAMEDARENFRKATVFYIMNNSSELKDIKASFSEIENSAAPAPNYTKTITGDSTNDKIKSYEKALSDLYGDMCSYLVPDNGGNGWFQQYIGGFIFNENFDAGKHSDERAVQIKNSDTDFYNLEFGGFHSLNVSNTGAANYTSKYPNNQNVMGEMSSGSKKWFVPLWNGMSGNGDYANNCKDAQKIFDVQKAYVTEQKDGIKEFIENYRKINAISLEYDRLCKEYKTLLIMQFKEQNSDLIAQTGKLDDVLAAWKDYCTDGHNGYNYYTYQSNNLKLQRAVKNINDSGSGYIHQINKYIDELNANRDVFVKYARFYADKGFDTVAGLYALLDYMKNALGVASNALGELIKIIDDLDKQEKVLQEKIDKIEESSTKAIMQSDHDELVDQFKKEEVEALKKVVDEIIPKLETYKTNVCNIKYLEVSVVNKTSINGSIKNGAHDAVNDGIKSKAGKWLANKIIDSKFVNDRIDEVLKDNDLNGDIPVMVEYENNEKIKSIKISNVNEASDKAKELIDNDPTRFNYDSLYPDGIEILRIIDGINDAKSEAIYKNLSDPSVSGKDKGHIIISEAMSYKEFVDENEKFIWTLYSIAESAEKAKGAKDDDSEATGDDAKENKDAYNNMKKAADTAKENNGKDGEKKDKDKNDVEKALEKNQKEALAAAGKKFDDAMKEVVKCSTENVSNDQSADYKIEKTPTIKKGKKAAESKTNGAAGSANGALGLIQQALNAVAQGAFMEEYFTEMFTCRTDRLETANVELLNGYSNKGDKIIPYKDEAWYGYEIEYILWGQKDLAKNYEYTDALIFVIRFGLNLIYTFTSAEINTFSFSVASAICIGPAAVAIPVVQSCIKILLAVAESGIDVARLHQGKDVPVYKSAKTFVCSPSGIKVLAEDAKDWAKSKAVEIIDEEAKEVQKHLNNAIEDINKDIKNSAGHTIKEYEGKLKSCAKEFIDSNADSVYSAVKSAIFQPIITKMTSMAGTIMAVREYQSETMVATVIEEAVEEAFETITRNISNMGSGVAAQVLKEVLSEHEEKLKGDITERLKKLYSDKTAPYDISASKIEGELDYAFEKIVKKQCLELIENKLSAIGNELNTKIDAAADEAAENAKTLMNEKINEATAKISGMAEDAIDKIPTGSEGKSDFDTQGAAGGITLNYKEYCKIFVLMFLTSNQDKMLQRSAVLVQLNMQKVNTKHSNFKITEANTLFSVRAKVKMPTLFNWGVESVADDATGEGHLEFDFANIGEPMSIGYCGINGY